MNLLQMKQKMIDLGISESYLADCCGVGKYYISDCLKGTSKSHPMTKKLEQKIMGVFRNLEIRKAKEVRIKPLEEILKPEPSPTIVYGPDVEKRKQNTVSTDTVTTIGQNDWVEKKKEKSPLKQIVKNLYNDFGPCEHHIEYDDKGLHITVDISIK